MLQPAYQPIVQHQEQKSSLLAKVINTKKAVINTKKSLISSAISKIATPVLSKVYSASSYTSPYVGKNYYPAPVVKTAFPQYFAKQIYVPQIEKAAYSAALFEPVAVAQTQVVPDLHAYSVPAAQVYAPQTYASQTYTPQTYATQTYATQAYAPQAYEAPVAQTYADPLKTLVNYEAVESQAIGTQGHALGGQGYALSPTQGLAYTQQEGLEGQGYNLEGYQSHHY